MEGVGHPGQQVGGAGAVGGDAHAGLAGDAAVAVRHQRRGLLVAGGEKLDVFPAVHAVEDFEHARSHDADYFTDTELCEDFRDCMSRGHLHDVSPAGCWKSEALYTMISRTVKEEGGQHKSWPCTRPHPLDSHIRGCVNSPCLGRNRRRHPERMRAPQPVIPAPLRHSLCSTPSFPRNRVCQNTIRERQRPPESSFPRRRESRRGGAGKHRVAPLQDPWIPAFAGMTEGGRGNDGGGAGMAFRAPKLAF